MESTAAQIELVRPWRRATLVAAGVAGVELVLLVILGLVLAGRSLVPHAHSAAAARPSTASKPAARATPPAAAKPKPRPARAARLLPRSKTGILVLNGNGISGAAADTASVVRARGYLVTDTRNAPRSGYPTWRLMTAPGYVAEAKRFARDLDFPVSRIGPLDGMTTKQLRGAKLVLIVGAGR